MFSSSLGSKHFYRAFVYMFTSSEMHISKGRLPSVVEKGCNNVCSGRVRLFCPFRRQDPDRKSSTRAIEH